MGGLAPGLGPVGGWPWPIARAHVAVAFLLGRVSEQARRCSRAMARGLEMRALDGVSTRSLAVSGVDLLHRSNAMDLRMGTVQGVYSWGSALGDGDLMRRCFRVDCGCFSWGGGGGKRKRQGTFSRVGFRWMMRAF
jgi:hypothetical protein